MKATTKYTFLLVTLYFSVSFVGILHHELWLDEAHHWLLARDSGSIYELIQATRIEGHPILWNVLLFGITRFTSNPFWMQLLNILIATASVCIFLSKAPVSRTFKILFIFGYFMIFEYSLISRNYMLGILFLFLACAAFRNRKQKFVLLCFWLILAANVHLMFGVIAFALLLILILENYQDKKLFNKSYLAGYIIFLVGILLLLIQILNTNSGWFFSSLNGIPFSEKISKGFIAFFKGIVLLPDFRSLHFWNTNLIVVLNRNLSIVLGLLIYVLPFLIFRKKHILIFIYSALIGMQVFFFITQRAAARFHGMAYFIIIIGFWLEHYNASDNSKLTTFFNRLNLAKFCKPIVYSMLILHCFSGIMAYCTDFNQPFASAKEAVDFIKSKNLQNIPAMSLTCDGTVPSAYLEKKIWFLYDHNYESYCHWDGNFPSHISASAVANLIGDFMKNHNRAVYISYDPIIKKQTSGIWIPISATVKVRFLKAFIDNAVVTDKYYIFEVARIQKMKS